MTKEEHGERFRWFDTRTTLEAMSRTYTLEPTSNRRSFVGTDSEGWTVGPKEIPVQTLEEGIVVAMEIQARE